MSRHRCAALRIEFCRNPSAALAATVHAMALSLLAPGRVQGVLDIRLTSEPLLRHVGQAEDCPAHADMDAETARWQERLPGDPDALLAWCLAQPQETLLDLLAFLAAGTVNAVRDRSRVRRQQPGTGRRRPGQRPWPRHDAAQAAERRGFYGRVSKAALVTIVGEARAQLVVAIANLKKPVQPAMCGRPWPGRGGFRPPCGSRRLRTPLERVIRGYPGAEQGSAPVFGGCGGCTRFFLLQVSILPQLN